jgi:hypothetical protein
MTVTLRIADGAIAAANGGGVVVGGPPTARTFTGTLANLNAFFTEEPARITYSPPANVSGQRQLSVTIAEGAGRQRLSSMAFVPVTITPADDPPVLKVPRGFTVTEDTPGNLVWRSLAVVSDRDSAAVTVRLSVDAGTITAASTRSVAVGGTPSSRTFRGSPGAVSAYFASLGRIRFTAPRDDTADRTLSLEADDGVNVVAASRTITVTPVNDAPTIAAEVQFAGGLRNTPFEITHEMLRDRSAAADVDSRLVAFRIESVTAGSLQRWDGANWVNLVIRNNTPLAKRLVSAGQKIRWLPPAEAAGDVAAFKVRAWDGRLASQIRAGVSVKLA